MYFYENNQNVNIIYNIVFLYVNIHTALQKGDNSIKKTMAGARVTLVFRNRCSLCLTPSTSVHGSFRRHIQTSTHAAESADIVISGGGMVGGAMACSLGNIHVHVA